MNVKFIGAILRGSLWWSGRCGSIFCHDSVKCQQCRSVLLAQNPPYRSHREKLMFIQIMLTNELKPWKIKGAFYLFNKGQISLSLHMPPFNKILIARRKAHVCFMSKIITISFTEQNASVNFASIFLITRLELIFIDFFGPYSYATQNPSKQTARQREALVSRRMWLLGLVKLKRLIETVFSQLNILNCFVLLKTNTKAAEIAAHPVLLPWLC